MPFFSGLSRAIGRRPAQGRISPTATIEKMAQATGANRARMPMAGVPSMIQRMSQATGANQARPAMMQAPSPMPAPGPAMMPPEDQGADWSFQDRLKEMLSGGQ